MASLKQLRKIFAPILAEYPDLVLHRRWLFRPPIEAAIIGLYIGRTSSAYASQMDLSVIPLSRFSEPSVLGFNRAFEVERVIGAPASGPSDLGQTEQPARIFQDMFAPEYEAQLILNFRAKVPAFLGAIRSLDEVIAWVLSLRGSFFSGGPKELMDGWVAMMRGDFASADGQLEAYFVRMGPPHALAGAARRQALLQIQAILRTNDPALIAAHFHAMEERTIAHYGLQRYWRPTPFPFERAATASGQ